MRTTERKHWLSGYSVRPYIIKRGALRILALRIGRVGVFIMNARPFVELYKLV